MKVTVRDRSAEPRWGHGPAKVATRQIEIADECPECGEMRGEPQGLPSHEDGINYWVQVWENPCGHHDSYKAVLAEAAGRDTLGTVRQH